MVAIVATVVDLVEDTEVMAVDMVVMAVDMAEDCKYYFDHKSPCHQVASSGKNKIDTNFLFLLLHQLWLNGATQDRLFHRTLTTTQ